MRMYARAYVQQKEIEKLLITEKQTDYYSKYNSSSLTDLVSEKSYVVS